MGGSVSPAPAHQSLLVPWVEPILQSGSWMAQLVPTSLSLTYTKARISYCVCQGKEAEGGEALLISGLAGLRGSGLVLRLRGVLGESFGTLLPSQSVI